MFIVLRLRLIASITAWKIVLIKFNKLALISTKLHPKKQLVKIKLWYSRCGKLFGVDCAELFTT
jgi:hypothetical protein